MRRRDSCPPTRPGGSSNCNSRVTVFLNLLVGIGSPARDRISVSAFAFAFHAPISIIGISALAVSGVFRPQRRLDGVDAREPAAKNRRGHARFAREAVDGVAA